MINPFPEEPEVGSAIQLVYKSKTTKYIMVYFRANADWWVATDDTMACTWRDVVDAIKEADDGYTATWTKLS
jgi:hypothetical protein